MQRVDGDAVGRRAGGVGQRLAELNVRGVADSDPVDRAQHDRLVLADEHDAARRERRFDFDVGSYAIGLPTGGDASTSK